MLSILGWIIYGFFVGTVAKVVFSYAFPASKFNDIEGLYVILLGAFGSYVGGAINFILGNSALLLSTSGLGMGILGAVVALAVLHFAHTKGYLDKWIN